MVCISDVHGRFSELTMPPGDILVIAGDLCETADKDFVAANVWIESIEHLYRLIIYVPGNHDLGIVEHTNKYRSVARILVRSLLIDDEIEFERLRIYGMPYESRDRLEPETRIRPGIDILVSHDPPYGILDDAPTSRGGVSIGNTDLCRAVMRIQPMLHVFGHAHFGHGRKRIGDITFCNVAICGRPGKYYAVANRPTIIDIGRGVVVSDAQE